MRENNKAMSPDKDFLYQSLEDLTTSSRPLKVLSRYATEHHATRGLLLEVDPELRVFDEWAMGKYAVLSTTVADVLAELLKSGAEPRFIEDIASHPQVEPVYCQRNHLHGASLLPLYNPSKQLIGWLIFFWDTPHPFNESEQATLSILAQQSAPVLNMIWKLTDARKKVIALQLTQQESEILRSTAELLSRAKTPAKVLAAVIGFPLMAGASSAVLAFREGNQLLVKAQWRDYVVAGVSTEIPLSLPDNESYQEGDVILTDPRQNPIRYSRAVIHLSSRDNWLGTIIFEWDNPYYFNESDHFLCRTLSQQVSAVVDSMQLFEEITLRAVRAERLLRVNTALSLAQDELQILNAVTQYTQLQRASRVGLHYIDTDENGLVDRVEPVAYYANGQTSYPPQHLIHPLIDYMRDALRRPNQRQVMLIQDITAEPNMDDHLREFLLKSRDVAAFASIMLYSGGRYQGLLTIVWDQPHVFTDEERYIYEELRQMLPALVASRRAYLREEKARREAEQRAHELETIAQISTVISSILDEQELLEAIARIAHNSFSDYRLFIYLVEGDFLVLIPPQQGLEPTQNPLTFRLPINLPRSMMTEAVETRKSLVLGDLQTTTDYKLEPLMAGAHSEMAIPIIAGDRVIGVVDVQAIPIDRFTPEDHRILKTLVDLIGVAVENARLYGQSQRLAVAEERNRIARELHDSVSQALYGIVLGARTAQAHVKDQQYAQLNSTIDYVLSLAKAGLEEIRAAIFDLRPLVLEERGLVDAIRSQANALQIRHGITVDTDLCEEPQVPFSVKAAVYRVVREALYNTVKHAKASQVSVSVSCKPQRLVFEIVDNGVGFDPRRTHVDSMGLKTMSERVEALKGNITIVSRRDSGTHISGWVPVTDRDI